MNLKNLIMISAFFLLLGCINLGEPSKQISFSDSENLQDLNNTDRPSIRLITPVSTIIKTNQDTYDVEITFHYSGISPKPPGTKSEMGEGHFHIILDNGKRIETMDNFYMLKNVKPGNHILQVELVKNDHSSFIPKIFDTSNFYIIKDVQKFGFKNYQVEIHKFFFKPAELELKVGDSVKWSNKALGPMTVVSSDGSFSSGVIPPSGQFVHTFKKEGTYEYRYPLYPSMSGKIIVKNK
ncbi:hypothetical protein HYT84_03410 [Candidatus Micrarchaeota archaeon]|nr:hypothetical protein [Candidatus Micrarchaeota archaeon]